MASRVVSRLLSTAVKGKASAHAPPKKIYGTVGRYAEAVFTAASKANLQDKVASELGAFKETMRKSPNFASFLANPSIPRGEKMTKISALLAEDKISFVTRNLFVTLAANGRIGESDKIVTAYEELIAASKGVVPVTIISAEALKKKSIDTLQAAVLGMVGAGKTADITMKVDPSILGGLQVMVGDKFLDLSVSARVGELGKSLDTAEL